MITKGLLVRVEATSTRTAEAEGFLRGALEPVRQEPGTTAWYALHFGGDEYGIIDVFPDEAGRAAHLAGPVAKMLMGEVGQIFSKPPVLEHVDVLASKLPAAPSINGVTKAVLLVLTPKDGKAAELEQLLIGALPLVEAEAKTRAWFALRFADGKCGIFDVFEDNAGRLAHLAGAVPRELAKHALTLLGGMPDPSLVDVLADKTGS